MSGVDPLNEDYIRDFSKAEKNIETYCKEFSGSFLIPDSLFPNISNKWIKSPDINCALQIAKLIYLLDKPNSTNTAK